ncbi:MAG: guanylate kinase [Eubacteriales bacterium]|nr:guanylate kinase [Eubacteriales bacterium]
MEDAKDLIVRTGILLCVSGPSGVGKGSLISKVLAVRPDMCHSVSVTTRAPRPGEKEGLSYYFRTREEFLEMLGQKEILEHDEYLGNYYGTLRRPIEERMEKGLDTILDITVDGTLNTMKLIPDAVSIFLLPPSIQELRRRLNTRGTESDEVIQERLAKALEEIRMAKSFDYLVVNDDLDRSCQTILGILEAEQHRWKRMQGIEIAILKR